MLGSAHSLVNQGGLGYYDLVSLEELIKKDLRPLSPSLAVQLARSEPEDIATLVNSSRRRVELQKI
jgi:hypothetical protein